MISKADDISRAGTGSVLREINFNLRVYPRESYHEANTQFSKNVTYRKIGMAEKCLKEAETTATPSWSKSKSPARVFGCGYKNANSWGVFE